MDLSRKKITSIRILIDDNYDEMNDGKDKIYEKSNISDKMYSQIKEYLMGKRKSFNIEYELDGTEFQKKVWKALEEIPYGMTVSYKFLAEKIGSPKAFRAVGNANNKNKLAILIPCHRVIGSNKNLVGYAYGIELKKYLIELESDNA